MNLFINFSVILVPFSIIVAIIVGCFFGIDFGIDFCIDSVDVQRPKMEPWDSILGQGASKNHRPLLIGPWVALGWWRRVRDIALKMVQAAFSSILGAFLIQKLSND